MAIHEGILYTVARAQTASNCPPRLCAFDLTTGAALLDEPIFSPATQTTCTRWDLDRFRFIENQRIELEIPSIRCTLP